jgi:hypothetical protein
MKRSVGSLLFLGFVLANACSSAFSSSDDCKETRTCPTAEDAGEAGADSASTSGSNTGGTNVGGTNTGGTKGGTDGCKPADTESCYESPDGKSFGEVPTQTKGACRIGVSTCGSDGVWGKCVGAIAPEPSDSCVPGNDGNCNGVANEGCPCVDGEMRDCGSDVGDCKKGKQTCSGSAWGTCVGEIAPKTTDDCDQGNDANCNNSPNDDCECINGTQQPCGKATGNCEQGEQTCAGGVWGECTGGITPQAGDKCAPAGDDGNCNGVPNEGCACTSGQTRDCGNCGSQKCGDDGKWPASCSGSGCEPGTSQVEDAVSCSYCGEQPKQRVCDDSCKLGPITNKGSCVQKECSTMPGDERTGYVICLHPDTTNLVCLPSQKCCTTAGGGFECKASCDAATEWTNVCDGPEDCTGGKLCCQQYNPNEVSYTTCATSCVSLQRCHADSDCPSADWHCSKYASASYHNGVCYPNGSNP